MNEKELFDNLCFLPSWTECETKQEERFIPQRKDLSTLLAELEGIKNQIEEIKAREWYLAKLIKFNKEGVALQ